jgi:tetratricopeptide (TPR) repeat protein
MGALGEFEQGLRPCERAIELWREIGDEIELTISLNSMGTLLLFLGRFDESRRIHEESLAIRRRIGDRFGIATSLGSLGSVFASQSNFEAAIPVCEESIDIFRSLGNTSGLSIALTKLGYILEQIGDYQRAGAIFEESLALQLEMEDKAQIVYSYDRLASIAMKLGHHDIARERWRKVFDLLETATNRALTADALEGLMELFIREGDFRKAARLCGAAEALRLEIRSPLWPYEIPEYNARVKKIRGALSEAEFSEEHRLGGASPLGRTVADAFAVTA